MQSRKLTAAEDIHEQGQGPNFGGCVVVQDGTKVGLRSASITAI